jgi:hypothetical protein
VLRRTAQAVRTLGPERVRMALEAAAIAERTEKAGAPTFVRKGREKGASVGKALDQGLDRGLDNRPAGALPSA